jgi:hypothetical protein
VPLPTDLLPVLGLAAALVAVADTIPYLRDILRGTTRPHRGTWLIWSLVAAGALSTFAPASVSGALATAAAGSVHPALVIYPIDLCVGNLGLAVLIHRARTRQRPMASDRAAAAFGPS